MGNVALLDSTWGINAPYSAC